MRTARLMVVLGSLTLALLVAGCRGPATPTPFPEAAFTQAAQTIIAELTQNAPAPSETPVPPSQTELPQTPGASQPVELTETASPTPTETGTPTPTPTFVGTPTTTPQILFEDDFSSGKGWYTEKADHYSFEFVKDGYRIYVDLLQAAFWSVRDRNYADIRVDTVATRTSGPENGYFGVVCRHVDDDNYYALVISTDGTFGIVKMEDGEFAFLQEGNASAGVINPGDGSNRVRGDCVADTLTLYANDKQLLQVQDDDFESGDVGLIAGTRDKAGLEVVFDYFAILEP
ncbi:MAG: hypothetical protein P8074_20340 [Anaerolineales bacterium]|jgi:hypothetical protein